MRKLFYIAAVVAIADPVLLYFIWSSAGLETALAVALLPVIFGPKIVAWAREKAHSERADQTAIPSMLGDELMLTTAVFLFYYPGPLTTCVALLLLIPAVRHWIQGWAIQRLTQAAMSGNVSMGGGLNGFVVSSMSGVAPGFPQSGMPSNVPLKQAEGRIVDDPRIEAPAPRLPEPRDP